MDRKDAITLAGLLMLSGGLYFVYPPAALIVPGFYFVLMGTIATVITWIKAN
jgi:hypothetical protein